MSVKLVIDVGDPKLLPYFLKLHFLGQDDNRMSRHHLSLPGRTTDDPTSAQFVAGLFRLRVCFLV